MQNEGTCLLVKAGDPEDRIINVSLALKVVPGT